MGSRWRKNKTLEVNKNVRCGEQNYKINGDESRLMEPNI